MIEFKRFTNDDSAILQYGNVWAVANCPYHADVIVEALIEAKIGRLEDMINTFEEHYSKKDIEKGVDLE